MITATIQGGQPGQVGRVVGMVVVNLYSELPIVLSVGGTIVGTVVGTLNARLVSPGTVVVSDPIALGIAAIESKVRRALGSIPNSATSTATQGGSASTSPDGAGCNASP